MSILDKLRREMVKVMLGEMIDNCIADAQKRENEKLYLIDGKNADLYETHIYSIANEDSPPTQIIVIQMSYAGFLTDQYVYCDGKYSYQIDLTMERCGKTWEYQEKTREFFSRRTLAMKY